jgi:hypothetical protein
MSMMGFSLDQVDNPHPLMLNRALDLRRQGGPLWYGYQLAMCDAVSCSPDQVNAWLDRHDPALKK